MNKIELLGLKAEIIDRLDKAIGEIQEAFGVCDMDRIMTDNEQDISFLDGKLTAYLASRNILSTYYYEIETLLDEALDEALGGEQKFID